MRDFSRANGWRFVTVAVFHNDRILEMSVVRISLFSRFLVRWRILFGLAAVLLLTAAAHFVPQKWRDRQATSFHRQCRELRDRKDWATLASVAESWSHSDPRRADAWLFRAEAAQGQKNYVAAADFMFRIPAADAKAIPAFLQGATILLGNANRPIEGIEALQSLLKREPRVADAHRHLIQYYALTLQRRRLLQQIRFAIANDREPPESYVYLFLVDTLRLSNGVEMNRHWLEQYPDHETFLVASALHMEEQREAARRRASELKTNPNPTDLSKDSPPGRSQTVGELFRRFPRNLELLSYEIEQSLLVGDSDQVISILSQAPPEIDDDNRFWRYKGQVHEAQGQMAEAESAYRTSARMNPLDWRTWNNLATIERLKGHFTEVGRLQKLVRQAENLRRQIRGLAVVENVGSEWLRDFADFAKNAGDDQIANALTRRLGTAR